MVIRKPPSDHDEWLEENREPEEVPQSQKKPITRVTPNLPSGAHRRLKALNDDIQEFG